MRSSGKILMWASFLLSLGTVQALGQSDCRALEGIPNLTILSARFVESSGPTPRYCYVRGLISPAIHYHVQLPLPENWNGRFVNWGDGGKDGDLDFADHRVAQGYAVANSNTGHDNGSEPGALFAFNNRQAEIDFGYRAVNLTIQAAKTLIQAYYGRRPEYSYHEGCSTGGRQGLMEAQRFPGDFDGIVVGAPVNFYQQLNLSHVWMLQRLFREGKSGMLAYDGDGDGFFENLDKMAVLTDAVLKKCDAYDGVRDGVIDDPLACDFDPVEDLAVHRCEGDQDDEGCFTRAQISTIQDFYRGAYDSRGVSIFKGKSFGSEFGWARRYIPQGPELPPPSVLLNSANHVNFLFYEEDPGVEVPDPGDISYRPRREGPFPEFAWWDFDVDDYTAGKGKFMSSITDAVDPDLRRFLTGMGGKLILYHGWGDAGSHPEPTLDYYKEVVQTTFGGDLEEARRHTRIFMIPGMGHCRGGPGPNEWDQLAPLAEWVENGNPPGFLVVRHRTDGVVDNERPVCAYPERAVYAGPEGGQEDPANWVADNFTCRSP